MLAEDPDSSGESGSRKRSVGDMDRILGSVSSNDKYSAQQSAGAGQASAKTRRVHRSKEPAGHEVRRALLPHSRSVDQPLLSFHTYAATAFTWSSVIAEPPLGSMMAPMAFVASAADTPLVI